MLALGITVTGRYRGCAVCPWSNTRIWLPWNACLRMAHHTHSSLLLVHRYLNHRHIATEIPQGSQPLSPFLT